MNNLHSETQNAMPSADFTSDLVAAISNVLNLYWISFLAPFGKVFGLLIGE